MLPPTSMPSAGSAQYGNPPRPRDHSRRGITGAAEAEEQKRG